MDVKLFYLIIYFISAAVIVRGSDSWSTLQSGRDKRKTTATEDVDVSRKLLEFEGKFEELTQKIKLVEDRCKASKGEKGERGYPGISRLYEYGEPGMPGEKGEKGEPSEMCMQKGGKGANHPQGHPGNSN